MPTTLETLRAVEAFQDALRGGGASEKALSGLCDIFGADCCSLELIERHAGTPVLFASARVDMDSIGPYFEHYQAISPRVAAGLLSSLPVMCDAHVLSEAEMDRDPFYAEFLPGLGLRYFLSLDLHPAPDMFAVIAFQFRPAHGHVDAHHMALAEAVRPLLRRSVVDFWARRTETDKDRWRAALTAAFRLTPAEADLAVALWSGESVLEHADGRGISRNTAYTHYARLKGKLGCRRQGDLIRKLHATIERGQA